MLADALARAFYPNPSMSWSDAFIVTAAAAPFALLLTGGLYLTKSALGINLMPGPSPFHELLYWMLV